MNTLNVYKFDELEQYFQNDALENVSCKMFDDFKDDLFKSDRSYSEISELLFTFDVTYTEILEEAKKLTFSYWGDVL